MATVTKKKIGNIPCHGGGSAVMVRETPAGTWEYKCDGCDMSPYAKKGTDAMEEWRSRLKPGSAPKEESQKTPEAPAAVPSPAPAAPPPKAKPAGPFDFLTGAR